MAKSRKTIGTCPKCGKYIAILWGGFLETPTWGTQTDTVVLPNYCPNCGTKLKHILGLGRTEMDYE